MRVTVLLYLLCICFGVDAAQKASMRRRASYPGPYQPSLMSSTGSSGSMSSEVSTQTTDSSVTSLPSTFNSVCSWCARFGVKCTVLEGLPGSDRFAALDLNAVPIASKSARTARWVVSQVLVQK